MRIEDAYRRAAERKDVDAILALMAAGVRMHSPTKRTPFEGKAIVRFLFGHLLEVLEDFAFTRVDASERAATLYFRCRIGGREAEGIDSIAWGPDGLIDDFRVMIRPLPALAALNGIMGARLAAQPSGARAAGGR